MHQEKHQDQKRLLILSVALGLLLGPARQTEAFSVPPGGYKIPGATSQLAVVRYKGKSRGVFTYYEKKKKGKWKKIFRCSAWLGSKGLGKKREGDKKTPRGVFPLGQSFGLLKNPGTRMPYIKVNRYHYWCGDSGSPYYNQMVRRDKTGHDCNGEHLIDYKKVYDYAVFIGYNRKGKEGKGSAVFLHCSRGRATAGCVAIPKNKMKKLLRRLKPQAKPKILIYK